MQQAIKGLLDRARQSFEAILPDWEGKIEAKEPDLLEVVEQAKQEWIACQRYFNSVTDPDLIDHAIMMTDAAQKKYMYLLRQAKGQGLRAFQFDAGAADNESVQIRMQTVS